MTKPQIYKLVFDVIQWLLLTFSARASAHDSSHEKSWRKKSVPYPIQLSSHHYTVLCGTYRDAEKAQLMSLLDHDGKMKRSKWLGRMAHYWGFIHKHCSGGCLWMGIIIKVIPAFTSVQKTSVILFFFFRLKSSYSIGVMLVKSRARSEAYRPQALV